MARDDGPHVGAFEHVGEAPLISQLEDVEQREVRRQRRVMHRKDRAQRCPGGQHIVEPGELGIVEIAVVPARHARVDRDQPESPEVVDRRDGLLAGGQPEQIASQRGSFVVVARDPDHG